MSMSMSMSMSICCCLGPMGRSKTLTPVFELTRTYVSLSLRARCVDILWAKALAISATQCSQATISNCLASMRWCSVDTACHKSTTVRVHALENLRRHLMASARGRRHLLLSCGARGVACVNANDRHCCIAAAPATFRSRGSPRPYFLNGVVPVHCF